MSLPLTNNPNRYEPNPVDDRRMSGAHGLAYLEIATALEAVTNLTKDIDIVKAMPPAVRRSLRSAENALRRSAWVLVATHGRRDG